MRVVTTSVKDDHLRVLWGEIGRFIRTAKYPLEAEKGGPLLINHRDIRKRVCNMVCPISYMRGMVSERGEGLAGHHANASLIVIDEASGIDDEVWIQAQGWKKKALVFGNPNQTTNFFKKAIDEGDVLAPGSQVHQRDRLPAE